MQPTSPPPHSYPGGKAGAGVYQRLINLMPPHTVYIEPFLGHGAVLLGKRPADLNIGLDLDPHAVQEVRTRLLHRQTTITCSTHETDEGAGAFGGADDVAAATLQTPRHSDAICSAYHPGEADAADIEVGGALYRVCVGDALAFLRSYPFTGSELVYCDPPYLGATRRAQAQLYRHEWREESQHRLLLDILKTLPCYVMLSGYPSALYAALLSDWRQVTYQAMTRGGTATEVVWMNYPPPKELHEYTYVGDNYRERERITRQQRRWKRKLLAMPLLERQALFLALHASMGPTAVAAGTRSHSSHPVGEPRIARSGPTTSAPASHSAASAPCPRASKCTVCRHPERQRIDQALAARVSLRAVARREGLSKSALARHRAHAQARPVSHFASGTPGAGRQRLQPPSCAQLDLLSLEAEH